MIKVQALIEDIVTQDHLTIGHRWFGLPNYSELVDQVSTLFASGRLSTENEFKVYNKGELVKPIAVEYNECVPALTRFGSMNMNAIYGERQMPGGL